MRCVMHEHDGVYQFASTAGTKCELELPGSPLTCHYLFKRASNHEGER
jgi:hypothetical protein